MRVVIFSLAAMCASGGWAQNSLAAPAQSAAHTATIRYHFAGAAAAGQSTNGSTWKTIWKLPATMALREEAWQHLMRSWEGKLRRSTNENRAEFQLLVHPLLQDLMEAESVGECRREIDRGAQWSISVHLRPERLQLWKTNLTKLQSRWQTSPRPLFYFKDSGEWLMAASAPGGFLDPDEAKASLLGAPGSNAWLRVACRSRASAQRERAVFPDAPAEVLLSVTGRGDSLWTEGRIHYAEPQNWKLEPWNVPLNTVREPLNGFTAVRTRPLLRSMRQVWSWLDLDPTPSQLFFWGRSPVPLEVYAAIPVRNATNAFEQIERDVVAQLNTFLNTNNLVQQIVRLTNRAELRWKGLPIAVPFLRPSQEPGSPFLVAGLFPVANLGTNLPPTDLLVQLNGRANANVLYYDWEITQQRLPQVRALFQLPSIALHRLGAPGPKNAQRWLETVRPHLGNTVTEITLDSPQDLTLRRRSHLGLSALELVVLARWLDSPSFPNLNRTNLFDLSRPIPIPKRKR